MNIIFAVTLLLVPSILTSDELNRSKKQINFGSDNEREGYFYDKPTISFDLPTQKPTSTPFVAATTIAPVPTGYSYPKPSIKFEENPKPVGIRNEQISSTLFGSSGGSSISSGTPSISIGGGGQTSVTTTFNKYEFNKPRVDIEVQKPSSFGIFGNGGSTITTNVNRYDTFKPSVATITEKTFTSRTPTSGISGYGQTSFVSNINKVEYTKPKIEITNFKPAPQASFGIIGTGVQKTTSQSTFGSKIPSVGISGGGQTSFVSTVNKYDFNKPAVQVDVPKPTPKPIGQSSFGTFGSGVQKTTSQSTFGSQFPSSGISGSDQSSFVSTANKYDFNKPTVQFDVPKPTPKPVGQSSFGIYGSGVQKTNSQSTFGSKVPSAGITGSGQTSFVSTVNKYDFNKPTVQFDVPKPTLKPVGQSSFGIFGSGVQKTTSQTTFGSKVPSAGISGGGQTSFVSTVNKYDFNKPAVQFDVPKPTPKPIGQSSFGTFGSGVQKTTSQSTFGSKVPSVGISGGGQTSFVSTVNKYDFNKPAVQFDVPKPTPKPIGQSSFGTFGSGVQKTTSQSTFGSKVPSVGISGGGQTSFVSTVNKYDFNKPAVQFDVPKPTPKPIGQSSFGTFGSGVQKTTSQSTFGSKVPSVGISGGGQTSFVSTVNKYDFNKPAVQFDVPKPTPKPIGQSSFGTFGSGVQKTTSQFTFGSKVPSVGISGGGQTSFVSTVNKYDFNKPAIQFDVPKPTPKPIGQSSFGTFGSGVQKTTSQSTFGSKVPSVGISGGGQTSFVSTVNKYDFNKPAIQFDVPKPTPKPIGQSSFGTFGSGVQKTTSQSTFGSKVPSAGISGGGQTSFVSTVNKYDFNKPTVQFDVPKPTPKPIGQSSFGTFGSGVQKTTSQSTFGSKVPSVGISGGGQTSFVSTVNKYDFNKPAIQFDVPKPTPKPIGQSSFGTFGSGVQKTTSQSTFGSKVPSAGISGGGQTSFVSTVNKYDFNKPTVQFDVPKPTPKPIGQSSFGTFGSGVQKATSQSTFGSQFPSSGITGSGQSSFVSTVNKYDFNKPAVQFDVPKPTPKPVGQSSFGIFGSGVQKTTSQSTFGSKVPSAGISGGGQTSFVSTVNKYDFNKPAVQFDVPKPTPKPVGQSSFGIFGSGVQKTTSQSTFGSKVPSVGISGGGQTSFVSTVNKYDFNKPAVQFDVPKPTPKPVGQSSFGTFGSGVQKTTSQSTFGSQFPSSGITGSGQSSFVSTANKYDFNKPAVQFDVPKPTPKPVGQSSFGIYGSGVQKTTSQSTFGSKVPSVGISGGGQTSFVSTVNKYDFNKPAVQFDVPKPTPKPIGQSSFGIFGSGVQKTTSQSTFGSKVPSAGISGGGQTSFVSTVNKYDFNKPAVQFDVPKPTPKPIGQSSFGTLGSGVQKTTSQSTFGSQFPSSGITGSGQSSFVSTVNKYDFNKPAVQFDVPKPTPKPIGQSSFGTFGSGVQKTTSQSTFGSKVPSVGISGGGQTSFVSTVNKYDFNKPAVQFDVPKPTPKPIGQSSFGIFGSGVQKTTSQSTFGSKVPSAGISGGGQTSFVSTVNKYDFNKPAVQFDVPKPTPKPIGQSSFGTLGSGVQKTTSQSTFGSQFPSSGITGSGQSSFVSTVNKYDFNKPAVQFDVPKPTPKPIGQSSFGTFGSGVQKTTSQSTFGSKVPSVGISGGGQTSFVSTVNKYDFNKPAVQFDVPKPTPKPIGQSSFGTFGSGVQKTTSQSTFGSQFPSSGITGSGQSSFVSTVNKYDFNKPAVQFDVPKPTPKPVGQSSFGIFGSGVQKTTSQSTFGSKVPSVGISGGGQTSFVSTVNKYDFNKPAVQFDVPKPTPKPVGQSSFGIFGSGVQKTTSQSTFGSKVPSVGISGGGQTSFVSTVNKYDFNKPTVQFDIPKPTPKPVGQSSFGIYGSGVQKTTSQSTFGAKVPSTGIGGSGQTSFVSTVNKFDFNKPTVQFDVPKPTLKPVGQSSFGVFGTGVQKTTSQSTFASQFPSAGISGSGQSSFVSTSNKYDFNKPTVQFDVPKPVGQSSFGIFGSGGSTLNTQKTTSTFSSKFPSTGSGQTVVFSDVNRYDVNKPKIEYSSSKPTGGSSFGIFSTQRPSTNAPEYLPPLGSTFQKVKYDDDIKYF